jgi:hypothetical protein
VTHGLDALGQLQVVHVQRLALDHAGQVDRDELGQLRGQALDLELGLDVADETLVRLDRRRVFFAGEVQGHLLAQTRRFVHALEVDVQDLLLPGVHLEVAQQHLLHLGADLHLEDGGVEGFLLQGEVQRVVIELDHRGRAGTIDDARHLAGVAQAAARSGPLQRTLESGESHLELQLEAPATRR